MTGRFISMGVSRFRSPTWAEHLERWAKKRKRPKSWREDERIIDVNLNKRFENVRALEVSRADVRAMLESIADEAPIMANRVLASRGKSTIGESRSIWLKAVLA